MSATPYPIPPRSDGPSLVALSDFLTGLYPPLPAIKRCTDCKEVRPIVYECLCYQCWNASQ